MSYFWKFGKGFNGARAEGTKKSDTVQPILPGTEPSYLRGLMTIQRQDASRDNAVCNIDRLE